MCRSAREQNIVVCHLYIRARFDALREHVARGGDAECEVEERIQQGAGEIRGWVESGDGVDDSGVPRLVDHAVDHDEPDGGG